MNPDVRWLETLFSGYDLYYVDPLIIKDAAPLVPPKQKSRFRIPWVGEQGNGPVQNPWYESDIKSTLEVLAKVRQILGVDKPNQDISQFFGERIPTRLAEDLGKQKQIVTTLISGLRPTIPLLPQGHGGTRQAVSGWLARMRPGASAKQTVHRDRILDDPGDLDRKLDLFQQLPNCSDIKCLVVLEGMITSVDTKHYPDLYQSVVVTQRSEDHYSRAVRFCLAHRPGPLLALDDWRIGLMVDQKGFTKTYPSDSGTGMPLNVVALDGWYPFSKVIGFWRSDRGGSPFIDILAVLIKTFPTMDSILRKRLTATERSFVEMLKHGRDTAKERTAALESGSPYNPEDDYLLLYPYLLATLCCHLNNTDWKDFETRGRTLFNLSNQYWDALVKLSKVIKAKNVDSWLPDFVEPPKRQPAAVPPGLNAPI